MFTLTKMEKLWLALFVLSFAIFGMAVNAATFPTWRFNDVTAGAVTFYTTAPGDQVSAGPGVVQITAFADTMRVSFHYYTGSAWVAMNGNVAYGDTNLIILPGATSVFEFPYPKPDMALISGTGHARVWGE
jgi:hypothetical protein